MAVGRKEKVLNLNSLGLADCLPSSNGLKYSGCTRKDPAGSDPRAHSSSFESSIRPRDSSRVSAILKASSFSRFLGLFWGSTTMAIEGESQQKQSSYKVEQLVSVNPYNPDILTNLENYVNEQVTSQIYSLDANLCLLRLYQFEPERMSIQIVARILIKALMAMPAPDFSLCLFLIPEQVQLQEQFKTLIVLSHYLETARFHQFWEEATKNHNILEAVPGFDKAIQKYAIHVLTLAYQKVPRPVLAETINIEGVAFNKFFDYQVANSGWALEKGNSGSQLVVLPRGEFNHPELKKNTADSIPLEHVTRIFPVLS